VKYWDWDDPMRDVFGMFLLLIGPALVFGSAWILLGIPIQLLLRAAYHEWEWHADLRDEKERLRDEAHQARLNAARRLQRQKIELSHAYDMARWDLHERIRKLREQQ
jgi:hypothetical protein